MYRIFFVRHGQSEFNAGINNNFNSEITVKGLEQVNRTAMFFNHEVKDKDNLHGFTSPYMRAIQTASAINAVTGIKFVVEEALGEQASKEHKASGFGHVYNNRIQYPIFYWEGYPGTYNYGAAYSDDVYKANLLKIIEKAKTAQNSILVSHICPIKDMIRLICFQGKETPLTINNGSISLVENDKLIFTREI